MKEEVIFITLQVALIASFLVIFFFSYVSKVENTIAENQVKYLVDSFTEDQKYFITDPLTKDAISRSVAEIKAPDLSKEDEYVHDSNEKLKSTAYQIILAVFLVGIIIFSVYALYLMNRRDYRSIYKMLIISVILLATVAITETVFLNKIAHEYISADPNYFRNRILVQLKKFSEAQPIFSFS